MPESASGAAAGADRSRQLLRRQLPAVLRLDAGGGRRATRGPRSTRRPRPACRSACTCTFRSAASAATSATSASTPTRTRRKSNDYLDVLAREWELYSAQPAIAGRPLELRLLRRRHAVVPLDAAARGPGAAGSSARHAVDERRGDHLRVRAGHAHRRQARGDPRHGRHAAQPRRRELRRPHPRAQRPRAPLAGDLHGLRQCARRSAFPQINIDLIAGMVGETDDELAALRPEDARARSPTASPSTRWSCRSTRRSAATC